MIKIEIPLELRLKILALSLPVAGSSASLTEAALLADEVLKFYQQCAREKFADHCVEFFRERKDALALGCETDAFAILTAFRNHTPTLQTAPATQANLDWLKNVFDCALRGQLHLRKPITNEPSAAEPRIPSEALEKRFDANRAGHAGELRKPEQI